MNNFLLRRCVEYIHLWREQCNESSVVSMSEDLRLELELWLRRWSVARKIKSFSGIASPVCMQRTASSMYDYAEN